MEPYVYDFRPPQHLNDPLAPKRVEKYWNRDERGPGATAGGDIIHDRKTGNVYIAIDPRTNDYDMFTRGQIDAGADYMSYAKQVAARSPFGGNRTWTYSSDYVPRTWAASGDYVGPYYMKPIVVAADPVGPEPSETYEVAKENQRIASVTKEVIDMINEGQGIRRFRRPEYNAIEPRPGITDKALPPRVSVVYRWPKIARTLAYKAFVPIGGGKYDPLIKRIFIDASNENLLAHELGHFYDYTVFDRGARNKALKEIVGRKELLKNEEYKEAYKGVLSPYGRSAGIARLLGYVNSETIAEATAFKYTLRKLGIRDAEINRLSPEEMYDLWSNNRHEGYDTSILFGGSLPVIRGSGGYSVPLSDKIDFGTKIKRILLELVDNRGNQQPDTPVHNLNYT